MKPLEKRLTQIDKGEKASGEICIECGLMEIEEVEQELTDLNVAKEDIQKSIDAK